MFYFYEMNRFFFLLCFPLFINAQAPFKKIRVLFLGNSYTYVNNLPLLVHDLALAKGDTLIYDSYAPGGYSFYNHSGDAATLAKISAGKWDYVVLQAQSQEPSFPPGQVSTQTLPYAIKLDSIIKHYNPCAHTVFYETWGRRNGDASNCAGYPPLCTYTGMQNRLRDSYKMFADTVHDLFAPVGEAWRLARATNTLINFYQSDDSHPLLEGSYLAAAVFYETLFQKSVLSSTYNPGIGTATVSLLNQVAHQLVTDSSALTNIPRYIPKASFSITPQTADSYLFQSYTPGFLHQWSFGDGFVSSQPGTIHTYAYSGLYTVSLELFNSRGCRLDSITKTVQVSLETGLTEQYDPAVSLYPNPCSNQLIIEAGSRFKNTASLIEVRNVMGQLMESGVFTGELNTSLLENGLYYLRIYNNAARINTRFVKQQ